MEGAPSEIEDLGQANRGVTYKTLRQECLAALQGQGESETPDRRLGPRWNTRKTPLLLLPWLPAPRPMSSRHFQLPWQ